jgi:hypothetical protein
MRRKHTEACAGIGLGSRSDSQDGGFRSQKTGWGVLILHTPDGRRLRSAPAWQAGAGAPHKSTEYQLPETLPRSVWSHLSEPQSGSNPSPPSFRIARALHGSKHSPHGSSLHLSNKPRSEESGTDTELCSRGTGARYPVAIEHDGRVRRMPSDASMELPN